MVSITQLSVKKKYIFFVDVFSNSKKNLLCWWKDFLHVSSWSKKMKYVLNSVFWSHTPLNPRHMARLESLMSFYTDDVINSVLVPVTTGEVDASLRLLDWFVINYSRRRKLHIDQTNIYQSYRNWRRFWRQDQFDVCRRGARIHFERQGEVHTTTVAQMNYMYWAHQHGVRAYVDAHKPEIAHDMSQRIRRLTQQGVKRKRLVVPSNLSCTVIAQPINVSF
jgi:hypothetical protein